MLRFIAVVVGFAVAGCFDPDVGAATIACDDDSDCPVGRLCASGLCVSSLDEAAPSIADGSVVIVGSPVRPGGTFSLVFDVTKPLGAAPSFRGDDLTIATADTGDDRAISATGVVDGGATDGERALSVALTGADGIQSAPLALGAIVIDGTGPEVQSVDAPSSQQANATMTVRVTATETLSAARCAFRTTLSASLDVEVAAEVDGATATCRTVAAGAPFADAIVVDVALTDVALNTARHDTVASAALTP